MTALDSEREAIERGEVAPDFELPGTDGETHALADFTDHEAVLVVFTCNHCPYAKAKFDPLNELAAEYDDLAVVGINANDSDEYPEDSFEKMVELVEDGTIAYDAYLRDESQDVARAYGAVCTPDPFLLENDGGEFRLAYHGRIDDAMSPDAEPTTFEMRTVVEDLLAGRELTDEFRPSRGCNIKWTDGSVRPE
ncbi:Thioredoxin family protein [Halorhabdus sp. SVX81]|uniref:thioredoxin family protein n=1 Tax=Halorhabdus sp. SVX81 TaxID=2978283 RepID=UPI0023DC9D5C|nr:thioredoxin family protein [Halorhabdus sp. SVX81]WEL17885.1 Thioredoxin family protein [Halorhabdus sp. SVX81]